MASYMGIVIRYITISVLVESSTQQSIDCDFERPCSLIQDRSDNFDWTLLNGPTPSRRTGPNSGHGGAGNYIYIEASFKPTGHSARLSTPNLSGNTHCVEFAYHMFGSSIGELRLYKEGSGNTRTVIWSEAGNQGTSWLTHSTTVTLGSGYNKIGLEGVRGNAYDGDIAIDDISVKSRACGSAADSCIPNPCLNGGVCSAAGNSFSCDCSGTGYSGSECQQNSGGFSCDFEGGLCSLVQDTSDNFDWTRRTASTPSASTGPTSGYRGSQYYIYIEATGKQQGNLARLSTPILSGQTHCVQFAYHMYGSSIGELRLYKEGSGITRSVIWSESGDQGNSWLTLSRTFTLGSGYDKIGWEGVRGSAYDGDIAIDDISVNQGTCDSAAADPCKPNPCLNGGVCSAAGNSYSCDCSGTGHSGSECQLTSGGSSCDFEGGFCTLVQDTSDNFDWTRMTGNTPSERTGPTAGYRGSSYYIYIEATGKQQGHIARLSTPNLPGNIHCVEFAYHMHGSSIGELRLYKEGSGNTRSVIWSESGDKGTSWLTYSATISLGSGYDKIGWEGVRGRAYDGDIALDNTSVRSGSCGSPAADPCLSKPCLNGGVCSISGTSYSCDCAGTGYSGSECQLGSAPGGYLCGFEGDFCSFVQDQSSDFRWSRQSGATPSSQTGPDTGYQGSQYYIYIEATDKEQGQSARLVSPLLSDTVYCVAFSYHMYGSSVGELRMYKQGSSNTRSVIWREGGEKGTTWLTYSKTVTLGPGYDKIGWEGVRGRDYQGDISLDNISLQPGACASQESNTSTDFSCNFENDICSFIQDTGDDFNWTRLTGPTPSSGTGPNEGNKRSRSYIYIETSNPRKQGDTARLSTPPLNGGDTWCVKFAYHMHGEAIGQLNVYTESPSGSRNSVWSMSGKKGDTWHEQNISVSIGNSHKIGWQAIRGSSYSGDIALDDLYVKLGPCFSAVPTCGIPKLSGSSSFQSGGDILGSIVGGSPAYYGKWPWQIRVTKGGNHACAGSIVAPTWVVTSAACTENDQDPAKYEVLVGEHVRDRTDSHEQAFSVAEIIPHHSYPGTSLHWENNISLLRLVSPVTWNDYVQPICLPTEGEEPPAGTTCYATGWGDTRGTGDNNILQEVAVPLVPLSVCNDQSAYRGIVTGNMICAGGKDGDTCKGDSGGPLQCSDSRGRFTLYGVTSWGNDCAVYPGVYTKVSSYTKWIDSYIIAPSCGAPKISRIGSTTKNDDNPGFIVGGQDSQYGHWPWQVRLRKGSLLCGGSLLSPDWVVTAAHCIESDLDPSKYSVLVGDYKLDAKDTYEQSYDVTDIIAHHAFPGARIHWDNDVAMLKLATPVTFNDYVQPICLPAEGEEIPVGSICYATGWGETRGTGDRNILQEVVLPLVELSVCNNDRWYRGSVTENMICAGGKGGDSCSGDSGGPMQCSDGSGRFSLYGITSWGRDCAVYPGVYTKVSRYTQWIRNFL